VKPSATERAAVRLWTVQPGTLSVLIVADGETVSPGARA
jgi:hypothetical protein